MLFKNKKLDVHICTNMFYETCSRFLICEKYFCNNQGAWASTFGHMFGSSKNVPTNIAIHPESLIRRFGIITAPTNLKNIVKDQEHPTNRLISLPYFGPY